LWPERVSGAAEAKKPMNLRDSGPDFKIPLNSMGSKTYEIFHASRDSVEFQGIPRDFETGTAILQDRQNAA